VSEYRYSLVRHLNVPDKGYGYGTLLWVMLNPSTADQTVDDPTIRRVKSFTEREGFRRLVVVNLFAQRSTKPADLVVPSDDLWELNRRVLVDALERSDKIIVAWGASVPKHMRQSAWLTVSTFVEQAERNGRMLYCLGKTNTGEPRHPLYVKSDQPLEVY
jgi:hypothetical protein